MNLPLARPTIILASRSPRRLELLLAAGYTVEVVYPNQTAEDGALPGETTSQLVARLAYQKAADVAARVQQGLILGCDTVAECNGQILGKPDDEHHARQILRKLRGQRHRVLSGLCLWKKPDRDPLIRVDETQLEMDNLSDQQIEDYIASGQWVGKAGAFGYQDQLGWVRVLEGSESNVVGLPMELLETMILEIQGASAT
jgi:septum formation protein